MGRQQASRSAVLVCQGRAVAHGRLAPGRFDDPTALALLRERERAPVEHARADVRPAAWSQRMNFELFGRQAEAMAARTVAIDDAVRAAANPQVVMLGAGLDGRAWRMPELTGVDVFEVDHPASQQDKRERASALHVPAASLRFVPVDFAESALGPALAAAGHQESRPTTWILEGVLPYLSPDDVTATVAAATARSAPGSRLVVSYAEDSSLATLGRLLATAFLLLTRRGDRGTYESRHSSWTRESVRALLADAGLRVTNEVPLASLGAELSVPTRHLGASHVTVADLPAS